jgi:hemerythrin
MPFMQWSPMMAIDSSTIDDQHRALIEAVNVLHDAVAQTDADAVALRTMEFLARYGAVHFAEEEAMLERVGYARLEEHRRQHQQFLEQVEAFRAQISAGGAGLGYSMSRFLGSWLVNHIMVSDRAYMAAMAQDEPPAGS